MTIFNRRAEPFPTSMRKLSRCYFENIVVYQTGGFFFNQSVSIEYLAVWQLRRT